MESVDAPLVVRSAADPTVERGDALVRVEACGICRSDWHHWRGDWHWAGVHVETPRILGHEIAGVVEAVGDAVTRVAAGDRVLVPFHLACGVCGSCRRGRTNLCTDADYLGASVDGGFAEKVRIPNADVNLVGLPASLSFLDGAAMGCRYATAFHAAVHQGRAQAGQVAVVFGLGGLGLCLVDVLTGLGTTVVGVDVRASVLARAERLGAVAVIDVASGRSVAEQFASQSSTGADLTFDTSGSAAAFEQAVALLRPGGTHVQVGLTDRDDRGRFPLAVEPLVFREISVVGCLGNPHWAYRDLLRFVEDRRHRPGDLVARQVDLVAIPELLSSQDAFAATGMTVVRPSANHDRGHG